MISTARSRTTPQRVFIHVGAPKTGTTYLQRLLLAHQEELRTRHGLYYATEKYDTHFFAALDLQDGKFHGRPRPESQGYWPKVAAMAREWPGTSLISHEVFAAATLEQAQRAVADLAPAEVHVIYTARDLARQLPSRWQEDVKHGLVDGFEEWWGAVLRQEPHPYAQWFRPTDDPCDVISRWGAAVGPERFHLVTVPRQSGSNELWSRFCQVIGLAPDAVDLETSVFSNPRLGITEAELLRRVNVLLGGRLPAAVYGRVVKGILAHRVLAASTDARSLALPQEHFAAVDRLARDWVSRLRDSGVDIVGDVEDLLPQPAAATTEHPGSATDAELLETSTWALKELVLHIHEERKEHRTRTVELERRIRALDAEIAGLRGQRGPGIATRAAGLLSGAQRARRHRGRVRSSRESQPSPR